MYKAPLLPPITSFDAFRFPTSAQQQSHSSPSLIWQTIPYNRNSNVPSQKLSVYVAEAVTTTSLQPVTFVPTPSMQKENLKRPAPSLEQQDVSKRVRTSSDSSQPSNFGSVEALRTKAFMKKFPDDSINDFKHVLYNCLVDHYNSDSKNTFVQAFSIKQGGITRHGFKFNERENPEKKLAELYAWHLRKARLDVQDQSSVFIQDLYKFYLRSCIELLTKYFEKRSKWTYLYDDIPLFVPGGTLAEAADRMKLMRSRFRKKKRVDGEEEIKPSDEENSC